MEACLNKNVTKFILNKAKKNDFVKLSYNKDVFKPTETSKFLLEAVVDNFPKKKVNVLDLGCGNGIIGIYLLKKFKNISNMSFSDVSGKAITNAKQNCKLNKISQKRAQFIQSNLFNNMDGLKFDIIINDVSGISYKIARKSNWFKNIPCESGEDGTKLTLNVIKNFRNFLKPNGKIFFPIISFSNEKKIINYFNKSNIKVKMISVNKWPAPKEFYNHILMMKKLKKLKKINFDEKYGLIIANTKIFQAN